MSGIWLHSFHVGLSIHTLKSTLYKYPKNIVSCIFVVVKAGITTQRVESLPLALHTLILLIAHACSMLSKD